MATENEVKKKHGFATAVRWILGLLSGGISEAFVNKDALEMSEDVLKESGSSLLSGLGRIGENVINKYGETGLTERDIALNDMALSNMQAQADVDRYLRRSEYQDKIESASSAGINPYFAVSGGVSSPAVSSPSTPAAGNNGDLGGLINVLGSLMMAFTGSEKNRAETRLIQAQEKNTEADTGLKEAQTGKTLSEQGYIDLQKEWFPRLSDATIREVNKRIDVADSTISVNEANAAKTWVETSIAEIDREWLPKIRDAEYRVRNAEEGEKKANAAKAYASAMIDELEAKYMKENNAHMGSAEFITVAEWILSRFGTNSKSVVDSVLDVLDRRGRGKGGATAPDTPSTLATDASGNSR